MIEPSDNRALKFFHEILGAGDAIVFRRCCYCGWHCYGRACQGHRDLLSLDPNYTTARSRP